ncbi:MAG: Mur ligase family protein [bacterium]|nr:Mur ligase family protein [bacterium]
MIKLKLKEVLDNCKFRDILNYRESTIEQIFTDSRKLNNGSRGIFICIKGQKFDGHDFIEEVYNKGTKFFVVQDLSKIPPKISRSTTFILVDNTIEFLGEIAKLVLSKRRSISGDFNVIAVAGSAGKTTTKNLIKNIFEFAGYTVIASEKSFNNEIGVPLTTLRITEDTQVLVLEMGMRGFGQIEYLCSISDPDYGVITSIGPEHLEFVKNIKGVIKAETELTNYLYKHNRYFILPSKIKDTYTNYHNYDYLPNRQYMIRNFSIDPIKKETLFAISYDRRIYNLKVEGIVSLPILYNFLVSLKLFDKFISNTNYRFQKNQVILEVIRNTSRIVLNSIENNRFYFDTRFNIIADYYNSNYLSLLENLKTVEKMFNYYSRILLFIGDMLELGPKTKFYHQLVLKRLNSYPNNVEIYLIGENFYQFKKEYSRFFFARDVDNILNHSFIDCLDLYKGEKKLIFIKGSRALKLERIHNLIIESLNSLS